MNYFFCDIYDTFDGKEIQREEYLKVLVEILENIMTLNGEKNMLFSFITSDDFSFLKKYIDEFAPFLNGTNIKMGRSYCNDKSFQNGIISDTSYITKGEQIREVVNSDNSTKHLYFADDNYLNHIVVSGLLQEKNITHFIPGNNEEEQSFYGSDTKGIVGLIKALKKYLNELIKMKNSEKKH